MKGFKSWISEEIKKGNITFYHPSKGLYKMTHHADDNVYHLHNKFGDLTHTFSGHMSPEDVKQELKKNHEMVLIDKLHEELITELKKPTLSDEHKANVAAAKKESRAINNSRGGYNETQLAKHLNGGKYIDKQHETEDKHHKSVLSAHDKKHGTQEVKNQQVRAKEQAHVFHEHAKKKGYEGVHEVHLTSKPGDIERKTGIKATQQENPTDVAVKFHKKPKNAEHPYLGISAKSSKSSAIGFHNGGTQEVGNFLTKHLG